MGDQRFTDLRGCGASPNLLTERPHCRRWTWSPSLTYRHPRQRLPPDSGGAASRTRAAVGRLIRCPISAGHPSEWFDAERGVFAARTGRRPEKELRTADRDQDDEQTGTVDLVLGSPECRSKPRRTPDVTLRVSITDLLNAAARVMRSQAGSPARHHVESSSTSSPCGWPSPPADTWRSSASRCGFDGRRGRHSTRPDRGDGGQRPQRPRNCIGKRLTGGQSLQARR
jgi:hypothetical protein